MALDRLQYDASNCSVAAALGVVGEKWSLLVLREAFYGLRRFDDFQRAIGCAKNMLAERLRRLVEHQLLQPIPYREAGQRQRFEYRLTERGRELLPVLVALMQWGDKWLATGKGPPVLLEHRECGAAVHVELRCAAGHGELGARDTRPTPGPGAKKKARSVRLR